MWLYVCLFVLTQVLAYDVCATNWIYQSDLCWTPNGFNWRISLKRILSQVIACDCSCCSSRTFGCGRLMTVTVYYYAKVNSSTQLSRHYIIGYFVLYCILCNSNVPIFDCPSAGGSLLATGWVICCFRPTSPPGWHTPAAWRGNGFYQPTWPHHSWGPCNRQLE